MAGAGAALAASPATSKTTRRITSSVIACIAVWIGKARVQRPPINFPSTTMPSTLGLGGAHAVAVEGREHQLAALQMAPDPRAAAPSSVLSTGSSESEAAGRQPVLAAGVERADRLRVGDHHHRALEADEERGAENVSP